MADLTKEYNSVIDEMNSDAKKYLDEAGLFLGVQFDSEVTRQATNELNSGPLTFEEIMEYKKKMYDVPKIEDESFADAKIMKYFL